MSDSAWEEATRGRERLIAWALAQTTRHDEAEDAVQETIVAAWRHGESLRDRRALWGWLRTVLVNKIRGARRKRRRKGGDLLPLLIDPASGYEEAGETESAPLHPDAMRMAAALSTLSFMQREVLIAVYAEGHSIRDFATDRGLRHNTARVRLCRARKALRLAFKAQREAAATPSGDELPAVFQETPWGSKS